MKRVWTAEDTLAFQRKLAASVGMSIEELRSLPPVPAPPPSCSTCADLGYVRYDVPVGHPLFGKLHPCPDNCGAIQQVRASKSARLLTRSGLPAKYARLSFESWYQMPEADLNGKHLAAAAAWSAVGGGLYSLASAAARGGLAGQYSAEPRGWLVLQGAMGVGKTGLAAAVVNERSARGLESLFYRSMDMFADIQSRYGRADELGSADDLIDSVKRAELLVLDELNVVNPSADKQRIVEEIIRARHGRDLPTIITCNVTPDEFTKMWGGRTADVVFESAHWVVVTGAKIRRGTSAVVGE